MHPNMSCYAQQILTVLVSGDFVYICWIDMRPYALGACVVHCMSNGRLSFANSETQAVTLGDIFSPHASMDIKYETRGV